MRDEEDQPHKKRDPIFCSVRDVCRYLKIPLTSNEDGEVGVRRSQLNLFIDRVEKATISKFADPENEQDAYEMDTMMRDREGRKRRKGG